jgi:predicted dehydrogenase
MLSTARVGVIGAGYWGPNLIRNFFTNNDCDLIAVADLNEDRLRHFQNMYPSLRITQDYHDLFQMELDAVVVATPPATHYRIAKECLTNGLHALVEKPLTLESETAQELIDIAESKNLKLMVGHTFEYNAAVRKIKEIVDSGELGRIYYINSVRVNLGLFQNGLNVLWDLAPHDISIIRYILGCDPISVNANGYDCIFPSKHDVAYVTAEFPNRIMAHIHVSWLDPNKVRRTTIVGSEKMLVYDDIEPLEKIRIYDKGVDAPPYTDSYADFQFSYRYGDVVIPHIQFTEPLRVETQHFIDCVLGRVEQPQSNGQVGLAVVKTLEAADRSLKNRGERQWLEGQGNHNHNNNKANKPKSENVAG